MRSRPARALVAAAIGVVFLACGRELRAPPNVLLIVIDTLRADRLGAYGNRDGLTPFLDELAGRATVFERAYAQAPWTMPSVASLWTSRYPSQHGVVSFAGVLADGALTLAEGLRGAGYATGGFSANGLIDARSGFDQGFDVLEAADPAVGLMPPRADAIAGRALAWLDARPAAPRRPAFLYVHLMETHAPYAPPDDLVASRFGSGPRPDLASVTAQMQIANVFTPPREAVSLFEALYDVEVRSVDRELRSLFAALEQRGFLRDALVIVTADHGDEFGEHGVFGHGETLFEHVIRVPLLAIAPGQTQRREVAEPVALIDVAPTVLAWAGALAPAEFMGRLLPEAGPGGVRSWLDALLPARSLPARDPALPVVSELLEVPVETPQRKVPHERAIVRGSEKLVRGAGGELAGYDLVADPEERAPDGLPESERTALARSLDSYLARVASEVVRRPSAPAIDEGTRARMRALGYAD